MKHSLATERAIKLAREPRRERNPSMVNKEHRMSWHPLEAKGDDVPQIKGHTSVLIKEKLIFFGGYDGSRNSNAVHILDTRTWEWRTNVKCSGAIPESRNGHTATAVRHCMYILGGWLGNGPFASNTMHVLNTKTFEWIVPPTTGTPPGPCNMHSTDFIKELGVILVFRGGDGAQYLNDLHCLDLRTSNWKCLETTGESPTARANHGSSTVGRRLFIFGGWDGQQRLNDMHCFEVGPNVWTKVACRGIPPAPRTGMAMLNVRDKLYVFGGAGVDTTFNDLHIFDPRTLSWILMGTDSDSSEGASASSRDREVSYGRQRGHSATPSQRTPWHSPQWGKARAASAGAVNAMMDVESSSEGMFSDDTDPKHASSGAKNVKKKEPLAVSRFRVLVEGVPPGPRSGHSATAIRRGRRLLIFGGSRELTYPTDLIMLDTDPPPVIQLTQQCSYSMIQSRMTHFFDSKEMSDVTFTDGTNSVHAHRILLALQSERFRAMFSLGFRETTEKVLPIPVDVDFLTFRHMLQFLYTGTLPQVIQSWGGLLVGIAERHHSKRMRRAFLERNVDAIRGALALMRTADQFMIRTLKEKCEVALGELLKFKIVSADELMKAAASANAEQLVAVCRHHIRNGISSSSSSSSNSSKKR